MTAGAWIAVFDVFMSIFWYVTYIECIRVGLREKTYCMPLLAMWMNILCEMGCFYDCIADGSVNSILLVAYGGWMLDLVIVYVYLMYGRRELMRMANNGNWHKTIDFLGGIKNAFIVRTLFTFSIIMIAFVLCKLYVWNWKLYAQFVDNLIMSSLFILMLFIRGGSRGQRLSIAVTKCLGTASATMTIILGGCSYIMIGIGTLCFFLDIAYIILLYRTIQAEKSVVLSPKNKRK